MTKKIFFDTNIIADIIDEKRLNHLDAIKIMEKVIKDDYIVCMSEDMITTLYYISKSKKETLEFFKNVIFIDWEILAFDKKILAEAVEISLENSIDLEDILQSLCAKYNGCETIITHDSRFYNCGVSILNTKQFLDENNNNE